MKATIVGVGEMGLAVAWAMKVLGFDLQLIETDERKHPKIKKLLGVEPETKNYADLIDRSSDVVISCLPYDHNAATLHEIVWILETSIPYCDLGGNPEVSQSLQKEFGKKLAMFTDLGLAPGYINIMAEDIVARHGGKKVTLRCGGLPQHPTNLLKYAQVFSIEGLVNEYSGDCDILKKGKISQVPTLTGYETWEYAEDCYYEAFYTKGVTNGSLESMKKHGVKDFCYKTIRYEGHLKILNFLMDGCKIVGEQLEQALRHACPKTKDDKVLIEVSTDTFGEYLTIYSDKRWTAMQKATAFPTAAVAAIMAKNKEPKIWTYADVPVDEFKANLRKICGKRGKAFADELEFTGNPLS